MKKCKECKEDKPLSEFYIRKSRGTLYARCKPCHQEYNKENYQENKEGYAARRILRRATGRAFLIAYLKDNPCVDCGNDDIEVLQFDHRVRSEKKYGIASIIDHNVDTIKSEISKCDVRCANCHTKKTRRQMGWWTADALDTLES